MDIVELKSVAAQHVNKICLELLPEGIREGDCWKVGNINGEKGRSLSCYLSGADAGKWTDFATGDHGDVIDLVRTIHGSTLLDSIDWIKKRFGIRDTDQAKKLKAPVKKYNAPIMPAANEASPNLHRYLESRGFRDVGEICHSWKLYEAGTDAKADLIFPFYSSDDTLTCGKTKNMNYERTSKGSFCGTGAKLILFGWQAMNPNARTLWITEGELDAIALSELGFPALSLPNGAAGLTWIQHELPNLDRFDEIVIATDQDEEGEACAQKLIGRLGERCMRVRWEGAKDANELLQKLGYDHAKLAVQKAYDSAKWIDPDQLKSVMEFHQVLDDYFDLENRGLQGYEAGWEKLNDQQIRFHGLWGVTGINGHGKSMWLGQLVLNLIKQGGKALIASMEMAPKQTIGRMMQQASGGSKPPKPYRDALLNWMSDSLWLYVDQLTPKPAQLMKTFEYAYRRYGIDVFVVDSLTNMVRQDDYAEQQKFVELLVNFKLRHPVTIFLVTHARKGESEAMAPNKFDVKGSGSITDLADGFVSIWKNKKKSEHLEVCEILGREPDEEIMKGWDMYLDVLKNRNGSFEGKVGFEMHQDSLQYLERRAGAPKKYINYSKESS